MARKLDKILVVDVEATCWEGRNPEGMSNDIIEIGLCMLDVNTGKIDNPPSRSSLMSVPLVNHIHKNPIDAGFVKHEGDFANIM